MYGHAPREWAMCTAAWGVGVVATPSPRGRLLGEQDPGCGVRSVTVSVRGRRAAVCPSPGWIARAPASQCRRCNLPGALVGWLLGLREEEEWLCWGILGPYLHRL